MVYFIIGFVVALLGNIFFKKVNKINIKNHLEHIRVFS